MSDILFRQYLCYDALISVAPCHLIPYRDFSFARHEYGYLFQHPRRELVTSLNAVDLAFHLIRQLFYLLVGEGMPKVAEVADGYVVDLDEVDGIFAPFVAPVLIVEGGNADDKDVAYLVFARPADQLWLAANRLD